MKPKQISSLIIIAFLFAVLSGCGDASETPSENPQVESKSAKASSGKAKPLPVVEVMPLELQTFIKRGSTTASVDPVKIAMLSSLAEGPVTQLNAREGKMVKKDEILLTLGRDEAQHQAVLAAEETLKRYRIEYERAQSLILKGAISQELLDRAKSDFKQAQSTYQQALQAERDFSIDAPWDGMVSKVHAREGSVASSRQALIELYDPTSLVLRFELAEREAMQLHEGDMITARLAAYPKKSFELKVTCAFAELDRVTRKRRFEADLSAIPLALIPGLFAQVEWVSERYESVFVVPTAALVGSESLAYKLYRLDTENRVESVPVSVLSEYNEFAVLAPNETLKPNDRIIIRGSHFTQPGQLVRVTNKDKAVAEKSSAQAKNVKSN